jgi:hypothetical protein
VRQSAEARYFSGVSDLRSHLAPIESPDLWRRINPHLSITSSPFAGPKAEYEFSARDHRFPPELVEIALWTVKALPGWEDMVPDNVC